MGIENFLSLELIHKTDRNQSFILITNDGKRLFIKKPIKSDCPINRETIPISFYRKFVPDLIPEVYSYDETSIVEMEWLDDYKWISLCDIFVYPELINAIKRFLLCETNDLTFIRLKETLSEPEYNFFMAAKCKLINRLVATYNGLKKRLGINDNVCIEYRVLLDKFVRDNHNLIHGDLNQSNILYNGKTVKFVDFEFTTFSRIEFEIGRMLSSLVIAAIEDSRVNKAKSDITNKVFKTIHAIMSIFKDNTSFNKILCYKYTGFYMMNSLISHVNTFTLINDKENYFKYFFPYARMIILYNDYQQIKGGFFEQLTESFLIKERNR